MSQTYNVQVEDSEGNKYCPKPDLLTTKEQLAANKTSGKSVDALVVKELNEKLAAMPEFHTDSTGKITGYRTKAGADTVFPFRSGKLKKVLLGESTKTCSYNLAELGYNVDDITDANFFNDTSVVINDKSDTGVERVNSTWAWSSPIVTFTITNSGTGSQKSRTVKMSQYFLCVE